MSPIRIGQGIDVHAFEAGDHLMICGVKIPFNQGFKAHSDGDVALHALCDAILGAAGLGDIGHHFPDTDAEWAGADSAMLLNKVIDAASEAGWVTSNCDLTIVAQAPRLAPHIEAMRLRVAELLGLPRNAVNIKATTSEHLGFTGRKEGVAAFAVCLLQAK
ncbi:MAG: 2-C-methyl-D-erythritol 2,4-cyclodiphosphate synthase [Gammaproteobacteria bacterium]|nr:2-C-methyl-D-erythritol 2,4-cyclodiphosphate synthase [Gammaproteobacteria bacterium]